MYSSGNMHPTASIHSLPADVLTEIFLAITQRREFHYQCLHTLAQVCKTWAHLIKNSPAFWRLVHNGAAYLLPDVLARSAGATLDIDYAWADNINEDPPRLPIFRYRGRRSSSVAICASTRLSCVRTQPYPGGAPPYARPGSDLHILSWCTQTMEIPGWRNAVPTLGHSGQMHDRLGNPFQSPLPGA